MPHEKKFTPETEADIFRRYTAGESSSALAKEYDTSVLTVTRIIRRNGGEVRSRHANRLTTPEQDLEIAALYDQGVRTAQIAARYDLPIKQIAKIVAREGVQLRRKGVNRLSEEQERELVALYEAGMETKDLAAKFGIYTSTVTRVVRRLQSDVRPKWRSPTRKFSEEEIQRMADLWRGGMSQAEIGRQIGTTQLIVSRVLREAGIESFSGRRNEARGPDNPAWKGGRVLNHYGYYWVWCDHNSEYAVMRNRTGYVLEHRLVMAQMLGRPLTPTETVHHVNGIKTDNRPENLQIRQGRHGKGVVAQCLDCGSHNIGTAPIADHDD